MARDTLGLIADICTIIGFPMVLFSLYEIWNKGIVIYDMYREQNEADGYTVVIGSFSRKDYRTGKRENPSRQYHIKSYAVEDESGWQ